MRAGSLLDGQLVVRTELAPYGYDRTYDILPRSDTGAYFAAGALIGSTLRPPIRATLANRSGAPSAIASGSVEAAVGPHRDDALSMGNTLRAR